MITNELSFSKLVLRSNIKNRFIEVNSTFPTIIVNDHKSKEFTSSEMGTRLL